MLLSLLYLDFVLLLVKIYTHRCLADRRLFQSANGTKFRICFMSKVCSFSLQEYHILYVIRMRCTWQLFRQQCFIIYPRFFSLTVGKKTFLLTSQSRYVIVFLSGVSVCYYVRFCSTDHGPMRLVSSRAILYLQALRQAHQCVLSFIGIITRSSSNSIILV